MEKFPEYELVDARFEGSCGCWSEETLYYDEDGVLVGNEVDNYHSCGELAQLVDAVNAARETETFESALEKLEAHKTAIPQVR